ncbi:MAG: DUF1566 domain-containing protein [Trichlorobacter sp.]|uniref:Lcl C-terminal domain-containing protein n=1 Tax=Trichlorobacter sp. TaxID=2911007 RepID=UPI002561705E|nr:DUF1566 domain-containing protein [Trichlorobacter sp.]MDK9719076.1 DUF1566 domain-containing protein [Trichlorobacter sp.]
MRSTSRRTLFLLFSFFIFHSQFLIPHSACAAGKLPDTGQTKCYNTSYTEISCAGTGQDGAYSINPMSFTDNGDGTVTDNNTGLVWQKCSMGQNSDATCSGTATTHNWYQASGTYDASYNAAITSVCGSLALAGGGWRLPSKKELVGIVDYSIPYPGPSIPQATFPNTVSSYYWSSTTYASSTSSAWGVGFYDGNVGSPNKGNGYYVRCVRGGQ